MVSDQQIVDTCRLLFEKGLKVEPSGCAAVAALVHGKVPELARLAESKHDRKLRIVAVVSGGNISVDELANLIR